VKGLRFANPTDRRLVIALSATALLLWVGGSAILPLLPVYLRAHGSSPVLVGATMGAYYFGSVLTQFPIGRLADSIGCSPVIIGGLVTFAVGSCGFAITSGPGPAIGFRALQGIGAGAVLVASAALIGRHVAVAEQGRAFGALYGAQMLALAIGPLIGSISGLGAMHALFAVAAAIAMIALVPVVGIVRDLEHAEGPGAVPVFSQSAAVIEAQAGGITEGLTARAPGERLPRIRLTRSLVGAALAFAAGGLLGGMYDSCWTLLLTLRHATDFEVGLSWTLFALPFAVVAVPAGRLAERFDRKLLTVLSVGTTAAFALVYPNLHIVWLLVCLGSVEAICWVISGPAAVLVVTETTPAGMQGQAQGAIETARTAATAVGAAAGGALFGIATILPFAVASGIVFAFVVGIAWCWRDIPGRVVLPAGDMPQSHIGAQR
jgi:MFS transporter, DHA1 family, multidrug resistance protein